MFSAKHAKIWFRKCWVFWASILKWFFLSQLADSLWSLSCLNVDCQHWLWKYSMNFWKEWRLKLDWNLLRVNISSWLCFVEMMMNKKEGKSSELIEGWNWIYPVVEVHFCLICDRLVQHIETWVSHVYNLNGKKKAD